MRTTVIPAQITTVEDTIAGNLNLTQIVLLVTPIIVSTAIYSLLPEQLVFTPYKIPVILSLFIIFMGLSFRLKGRLVLQWLVILSSYMLRPHIYLFNKNTLFARELVTIQVSRKKAISVQSKLTKVKETIASEFDSAALSRSPNIAVRFDRKGLLVVKNHD